MPLFLDVVQAFVNTGRSDLLQIVRCDTGLGDSNVPGDNTAVQITYTQNTNGAGQNRMAQLVGVGSNIVISPVDSSFVFPDNTPITAVSGRTFLDGAIIRVAYDASWAADNGYFVLDTGGNAISFPTPVMLFHELSHAFHLAIGDSPPPGPAAEFQAETDEDAFRAQVGLAARDPNNHDGGIGVGNGESVPDCTGGGGCFIVSAALGSPHAAAVRELQQARDALSARSPLCGEFLRITMQEYYAFSRPIAAEMMRRPALARAIDAWMVAPLLRYRDLLDCYVAAGGDLAEFVRRCRSIVSAVAGGGASFANVPPSAVAVACNDFARRLSRGSAERTSLPTGAPDELASPAQVFGYVAAMIEADGHPKTSIAWAAQALALFWTAADFFAVARADDAEIDALVERLEAWLEAVPLPPNAASLPARDLAWELAMLGQFLFRSARVRSKLAEALLRQAENAAAMRSVLRDAGYLPATW